ncbi:MAG: di-heme oxidoredictase family protein, partial [Pseudomonadota bacterium]
MTRRDITTTERLWPAIAVAAGSFMAVVAAGGLWQAMGAAPELAEFDPREAFPGGDATARGSGATANAFSEPSGNMGFARELDFKIGNAIFRKLWVSSPASTKSSDGLGPLYNARACQRCHLKDGRGHPPTANWPDDNAVSIVVGLSIPPQTEADRESRRTRRKSVVSEPTYGAQLQDLAIKGHAGEGRLHITYTERAVTLRGGDVVTLRTPRYRITDLGYGPLHPQTQMSVRIAPPMIGLGLLEAIPAADIRALADPDDANGDGISGRPQEVWSASENRVMLGRFGWKAGQPTILDQSAAAAVNDMGLGSWLRPRAGGDCTDAQDVCLRAPHGGSDANPGHEFKSQLLELVAFYSRNLAVPRRRNADDPQVLAGKAVFSKIGCADCHTPSFKTGATAADPFLAGQTIWPYTNLLLHDMGDALADQRAEGAANGREWRTPPLWGIGLTGQVS